MSGCLVVWLPGGRSGGLWYSDLPGRETVRLGVRTLDKILEGTKSGVRKGVAL